MPCSQSQDNQASGEKKMMRIKKHGDGEGKMGTVYNHEEKGDQSRLGFSLWCSVYQFSFSKQHKTNDRRVRKVSGTAIDG